MTISPQTSSQVKKYKQTPTGFQGVSNMFLGFERSPLLFGTGYEPAVLQYGVNKTERGLTFTWNGSNLTVTSSSVSADLKKSILLCNVFVNPNSNGVFLVGLDTTQPVNSFEANYRLSIITGGNFADITAILFGYLEIDDPNGPGGRDARFTGVTGYALMDYQYQVVGINSGLGMRNYQVNSTSLANIIPTVEQPAGTSQDVVVTGDVGGNNGAVVCPRKYTFSGEIDFSDKLTQIYAHSKNFVGVKTLYPIYNAPVNGGANWTAMACFGNFCSHGYTGDIDYTGFPITNELCGSVVLGDIRFNGGGANITADTMGSPNPQYMFERYRKSGRRDITVYSKNCYRFKFKNGTAIGFSESEVNAIPTIGVTAINGEGLSSGSFSGGGYNAGGANTQWWIDVAESEVKYRYNTYSDGLTLDSYIQNAPNFDDGIGQFTIDPALIPDLSKITIASLVLTLTGNVNGGIQSQWSDAPATLGFVFASRFPRINSSGQLERPEMVLLFQSIDDDGLPLPY